MGVQYRDYYKILGVDRKATSEEIRRAYRQLARKHHPDTNKGDKASEEKFKEINEAYEVLKDPEKRQRYDSFGADWKAGQQVRPPDWEHFAGQGNGAGFNFGGFSDFFEAMFGRGARVDMRGAGFQAEPPTQMADQEYRIEVPIATVLRGGVIKVTIPTDAGYTRTFDVKIPKGIGEGKKIRLAGEGSMGADILLKVAYASDGHYRVENNTLIAPLRVSVPVAVLGGKATVQGATGEVKLTIPPGTASGKKLRVRGEGLPLATGGNGDLLVEIQIAVPSQLSDRERTLYEELRELEGGKS